MCLDLVITLYLRCKTWANLMIQYKVLSELFKKLHLLISVSQVTTSIISFSSNPMDLESAERKGSNYKNLNI